MDNSYLSELKDIHMPTKPNWWPLSDNLIYLIIFLLLFIFLLYISKRLIFSKNKLKKEIKKEFIIIKSNFIKTQDKSQLQNDISIFIKRIIISSKNRPLTQVFNEKIYIEINNILQTDRFKKNPSIDADLLLRLTSELINKCRI